MPNSRRERRRRAHRHCRRVRISDPEATVDVAAPLRVSTVVAAVAPLADQLEAGGVVAARETATLTSRIVAPVIEVVSAPAPACERAICS